MIEQALYEHLQNQTDLEPFLATYDGKMAIFNQEAPADTDELWGDGPQYGRIIFSVDIQGDPERTMGGLLAVDIQCKENEQYPEDIEPVIRQLITGYFFSSGTFTVAAQWKNSSYFTEPTDNVTGCTVSFDLLAFPVLTTTAPDVVERLNEWTKKKFPDIHVINLDPLPAAWKPAENEAAIYWRVARIQAARWIPDTYQTIWRTATVKGHVFAPDTSSAGKISREITNALYASKRLIRAGESQIMTNTNNTIDVGADPLRTGQITTEGTYGVVIYFASDNPINNFTVTDE